MPIHFACDECGAENQVADESTGGLTRCKICGNVPKKPKKVGQVFEVDVVDRGYHPAFDRDLFLMKQQRLAIHEKYYVYDERQRPILFVERPSHWLRRIGAIVAGLFLITLGIVISATLSMALGGGNRNGDSVVPGIVLGLGLLGSIVGGCVVIIWLTPKRHISVYPDDTRSQLLLEIQQDRKLHFWSGTYTVSDPRDGILGRCEKVYIYNILRKRWYIFDPADELVLVVQEDSLLLSLIRRYTPPAFRMFFARSNFIVHEPGQKQVLGLFNRKFTIFDEYVFDLANDPNHLLDRRMAIAIGVLLDTGEGR